MTVLTWKKTPRLNIHAAKFHKYELAVLPSTYVGFSYSIDGIVRGHAESLTLAKKMAEGWVRLEMESTLSDAIAFRKSLSRSQFFPDEFYRAGDRILALGDALCTLFTAAHSFEDLVGPAGCSYCPTLTPRTHPWSHLLADIFDAVMEARHDPRRAWRG